MSEVSVNGASLAMAESGQGRAVVLVHGSASDQRTWTDLRERWADRYRVITYSRRYHWPNDPIERGGCYALDDHVADLVALVRGVGSTSARIVGHSYGALIALLAAARHPELVDALVLVEPPATGLFVGIPPGLGELMRLALRRPRTALGIVKLGARSFGPAAAALKRGDEDAALRALGNGILGPEAFAALSDERRAQVRDNLILEELTSEAAMPRLPTAAVAGIRCPVLLVGGERSPPIFGRLLDALAALLPHAQRVIIPAASHLVHEDNPAAFVAAVASFLSVPRPGA